MEFTHAANMFAASLLMTAELAEMAKQKSIFVLDIQGRLDTFKNKKVLDALMEVQSTLPTLSQLESFSLAADSHLMKMISQDKSSSKILYTFWVKSNAN